MTLILCLDDKNGMSFHGRRQSMDAVLRSRMLQKIGKANLWMNSYSAKQFDPLPVQVRVDDGFMDKAGVGEACFAEMKVPGDWLQRCRKLIIYRWNRVYPADVVFPLYEYADSMKLLSKEDFAGRSHERITEEVYEIM